MSSNLAGRAIITASGIPATRPASVVCCRSGRPSAIAADGMAAAAFTDIVDGGAMADLVAAGAPSE